ncbi:alpha/beta fold hydrolase [Streptomyces sp. NBC_00190]|uniref:alpha/beta fold hydrolase n=1 Tax=Streptomyces sp. NBC_00190 TaxID=2903634 RepID=UPI002E2D7A72|nr:alpha/beta hydrolase [Streptomyces sp. NBC_00190]
MTTTPWTLADVEAAIRAGWSAETSEPADTSRIPWSAENPAWGQCDITAVVVQDIVGGELVLGEVFHGGRQEGYHWWNQLPGGIRIDLTREQFRRGETVTPGRVVQRPPGRLPRRWEEYQLLRRRVIDKLGPLPGVMRTADGRRLVYTDFGGPGAPLLALHGHFQDGRSFEELAREVGPAWRVIGLDQRGHGASDRAAEYTREGYVADAAAVLEHLGLGPAVVVGHSLGGVNAYQLAARRPDLVRAVVVEDIGAVVEGDLSYARDWPRRAATRAGFLAGLGSAAPHLAGVLREYPDGWGTASDVEDVVESQRALNGDHWEDWLAVRKPTLLVRGDRSGVLSAEHAREMTLRRAGVRLAELPAGHGVRAGDPEGFYAAVRGFLARV